MHILPAALTALLTLMPQATSTVEGLVVKMGSGEALAGATVELHREQVAGPKDSRPETYTLTTPQDGKFVFNGVVPGTYRLMATRTNFVPAEYGQRTPTMPGISFEVTAGQKAAGIQLALSPTGSISGRIYDRDGEPVGRAQVQALRYVYKDGRRRYTIVQSVQTDDRGEYRLFWLAPGRYAVSAKPDIPELPVDMRSGNGSVIGAVRITEPARFGTYEQASSPRIRKRTLKSGEVIEETYVPVYYPGVVEAHGAASITLGAGAAIGGVDISIGMGLVPVRHIRGRVINAVDGQPLQHATVLAVPRTDEPLVAIPTGETDSNGFFDLSGATSGPYLVFASGKGTTGMVAVDVGNTDVQNIAVVTSAGFRIHGNFAIEGRSPDGGELKLTDLRIDRLTRDPEVLGMPASGPRFSPPVLADGSFILDGVSPGDFRVSVQTGSQNSYVKSMRMANADVLDGGLHISGPPEGLLEIVIGANAGRINGTVVNARQEPLPNRTVVLVPDLRYRRRSDLYEMVSTDNSGRFRIQGITPGGYQVFAWEDVEPGSWQDPDFIRAYEGRGKAIRVDEGSDEHIQLTVIP